MLRQTLAVAMVLTIGFPRAAEARDNKSAKNDVAKLQGLWTLVSDGTKRKRVPDEQFFFNGNTYEVWLNGKSQEKGSFTLDPSTPPAGIDLLIATKRDRGKFQKGLYQVKGDTLILIFGRPGAAKRPASFQLAKGAILYGVYKRQSKEK